MIISVLFLVNVSYTKLLWLAINVIKNAYSSIVASPFLNDWCMYQKVR